MNRGTSTLVNPTLTEQIKTLRSRHTIGPDGRCRACAEVFPCGVLRVVDKLVTARMILVMGQRAARQWDDRATLLDFANAARHYLRGDDDLDAAARPPVVQRRCWHSWRRRT